jgi:hypothetical protein
MKWYVLLSIHFAMAMVGDVGDVAGCGCWHFFGLIVMAMAWPAMLMATAEGAPADVILVHDAHGHLASSASKGVR